jgi:hypothetical protein
VYYPSNKKLSPIPFFQSSSKNAMQELQNTTRQSPTTPETMKRQQKKDQRRERKRVKVYDPKSMPEGEMKQQNRTPQDERQEAERNIKKVPT